FHEFTHPRLFLVRHEMFFSVGRMNHYATPSQNCPDEQGPARSSSEFMKYPCYEIELSLWRQFSIGGITARFRLLSALWLAGRLIR
ncbi:MAG: hypothetical protein Q8J70_07845, partial [Thiobacillus sp.]|nr:hypothetical protein [Thiobacillus sp.]